VAEEGASAYLPERRSLKALREAVRDCRGCDLYRDATQAVFGEGPA
jgi:DNA polymerase